MPYIPPQFRPAYDTIIQELIEESTPENFKPRFKSLVFSVAAQLYGSHETRYFKQNEFIGVLSCALLEWCRRTGCGFPARACKLPRAAETETDKYAALFLQCVPSDDASARPGHINYFVSKTLISAMERRYLGEQSGAELLFGLIQTWYGEITAIYEDSAISQNGDCYPVKPA